MNYKDPILKSKKKESSEIDITDMSRALRNRIHNISDGETETQLDPFQDLVIKFPEEEEKKEEENIQRKEHECWHCRQQLTEAEALLGDISSVVGRSTFLRGRWTGSGGVINRGYISKIIYWIGWSERGFINVERFSTVPSFLRRIDHNGRMCNLIDYDEVREQEYVPPNPIPQLGILNAGWFKISQFFNGNRYYWEAMPTDRILLYNNIRSFDSAEVEMLCQDKGIAVSAMCAELGISDLSNVNDADIDNIADYLNVKVDTLFTDTSPQSNLVMDWFSSPSYPSYYSDAPDTMEANRQACITAFGTDDFCTETFVIICHLSRGTNTIDVSAPISAYDRTLSYCDMKIFTAGLALKGMSGNFTSGIATINSDSACDARIEITFRSLEP